MIGIRWGYPVLSSCLFSSVCPAVEVPAGTCCYDGCIDTAILWRYWGFCGGIVLVLMGLGRNVKASRGGGGGHFCCFASILKKFCVDRALYVPEGEKEGWRRWREEMLVCGENWRARFVVYVTGVAKAVP